MLPEGRIAGRTPRRRIELLNARWAGFRRAREVERCLACGDAILDDDHAVRHAGAVFHAGCALYRRPRATTT